MADATSIVKLLHITESCADYEPSQSTFFNVVKPLVLTMSKISITCRVPLMPLTSACAIAKRRLVYPKLVPLFMQLALMYTCKTLGGKKDAALHQCA
jgi:hypothetical protein